MHKLRSGAAAPHGTPRSVVSAHTRAALAREEGGGFNARTYCVLGLQSRHIQLPAPSLYFFSPLCNINATFTDGQWLGKTRSRSFMLACWPAQLQTFMMMRSVRRETRSICDIPPVILSVVICLTRQKRSNILVNSYIQRPMRANLQGFGLPSQLSPLRLRQLLEAKYPFKLAQN